MRVSKLNVMNRSIVFKIAILIASAFVIAAIGSYVFTPGTTSDYVEGVFWSDASLQAGRLLSPDYSYPYAIPYGSNLLFLPFVHIIGTTQLANSLGMLLFFLIMTGTAAYFMSAVCKDFVRIVVGTALILLAFRSAMGVDLLHHVLFYQLGFVCFLGMAGSVIHIMDQEKAQRRYFIILITYAVWSGANGFVTIVLAAIPLLVSITTAEVAEKISRKKAVKTILIIVIGSVIGYGLYRFSMRGIVETGYLEDVSSYDFLPVSNWIENIRELPNAWLRLFVISSSEGVKISSISGMEIVVSIIVALSVGIIPILYLFRFRDLDWKEWIIFWGCASIWGICIAQFVFLRGTESRLLYNGICADFILLGILVRSAKPKTLERKLIILVIAVILAVFSVLFSVNAKWKPDTYVTDELKQRGLTYGVASFWNANINTVNSGGAVKLRPAAIENGRLSPLYFQSQRSWYELPPDVKEWFLLLSEEEYQNLPTSMDKELLESYSEEFEIQNYHVLVFPSVQWDILMPGKRVSYNFAGQDWAQQCESIDGKRHIHDGGMSYGPSMKVKKGVVCRVNITGSGLSHAEIRVYSIQNGKTLEFKPEYKLHSDTEIEFIVKPDKRLAAMEVAIRNSPDDDFSEDIVLQEETIVIED